MIVVSTKFYCQKPKQAPKRNQYIWANSLFIDEIDEKCPVIEG